MSLLDSVKNLFGFTPAQPVKPESASEQTVETPKPVSKGLPPAGQQRDRLLRFVIDKLRPYQNEPETAPNSLNLCILRTTAEEEDVYNVALWASQPGKFRNELARQLADNYIQLPADWRFSYAFYSDALPPCTYRDGNLGLIIPDKSRPDTSPLLARLVAVKGQTEQDAYELNPVQKTSYCIGRGHSTQAASGRVRTNDIVVLNDDDPGFDAERGAGNGAVSRAHATIRYDAARRQYSLLADPGGLPASGNKTKIFHPDGSLDRADIPGMGYPLQHGDQIELGGEVTLLFEVV
ncbi:FHA domain-containing protein [Spirosoma fluviale]|uniref:FHA domain-containing protein n=1 Tax=Spirosoma fluviale TaxID=1597977 RepID=A0A286FAG5_9BACT|nr:FHA domain-containing protein [Spirosoma fluviale]SOD80086.1 hypothetical protein SAMN06269250_1226 [Spirosoma fluviale]